ncbi:MAG: membrane protein insertase YidC [Actinomycetales bacterium]
MSLSSILYPLEWGVAWIMVAWHTLFTWLGMPAANGWTWVLSIVGLVLVIRTLLIPLFVRQIRSSRKLQLLQPEIKKIQDKYKGRTDPDSRQAMTRETMDLYKTSGTNPFASCLPILLQMPIFFALFRVLNGIPQEGFSVGPFTSELRAQADAATIFGAELSDTFLAASVGSSPQIIAAILVVLMTLTQFWSQRQLFMKNMPPAALDSPFAKQQKLLLYVLPVVFAISGLWFPLGVIMYWFTSNLFTTAQQYVVIQRMPSPGSPAEKALEERRRRKAERKALRHGSPGLPAVSPGELPPPNGASANGGGSSGTKAPRPTSTPTSAKGARDGKARGRSTAAGTPARGAGGRPGGPTGQRSQPKRGSRSRRKRG